jgi:hypothetical protein
MHSIYCTSQTQVINKQVKVPRNRPEGPGGWVGRGIALLFPDLGTLEGGGWSAPSPGRFTPRKDPVPSVQEAGWAPGTVWTGAENLAPNGIRSPAVLNTYEY